AQLGELAALPARGRPAPRTDGAARERLSRIGDDLADVDAERAPEAAAGRARAERRLVRKQPEARRAERARALGAALPAPQHALVARHGGAARRAVRGGARVVRRALAVRFGSAARAGAARAVQRALAVRFGGAAGAVRFGRSWRRGVGA